MRKIFFTILFLFILAGTAKASTTLYGYYKDKGQKLPSFEERAPIYAEIGSDAYVGSYGQNLRLLNYLESSREEYSLGATLPLAVADFETSLAQKLTSTGTSSMTLVSGTTGDGTTLNGTYGFTIDEGSSYKEYVIANCVNTACASLVRGISTVTGSTSVAALIKDHRRGANVKITDHPIITIMAKILNGQDGIPAKLYYDSQPSITSDKDVATKKYVDDTMSAGAADASETVKGISELATGAEAALGTSTGGTGARLSVPNSLATSTPGVAGNHIPVTESDGKLNHNFLDLGDSFAFTADNTHAGQETFNATSTFNGSVIGIELVNNSTTTGEMINGSATPQAVAIASTTGMIYKADADDLRYVDFYGFVTAYEPASNFANVTTEGIVDGFSGLTIGADYYISNTAGSISIATGSTTVPVGKAITATKLLITKGKRSAAGTISYNGLAAGAASTTGITLGFRPSRIYVGYSMPAAYNGTSYKSQGTALWYESDLIYSFGFEENEAGTAVTSSNLDDYWQYGTSGTVGHPSISGGTTSGKLSWQVSSVNYDGFVGVCTNTTVTGAGETISGAIQYLAVE